MPPPGQTPTAVWDGRSLLAGLEVSFKSWAGLPVTVAVVVVVGGRWCGQIACSAKAHALQPTRATFAFNDLPLLVGGGAGVHGHEEEGPALPGPRPLPLLCLVVVLLVCSSVFLAHPLDYSLENHADEGLLGVQCSCTPRDASRCRFR